MSRRQYYTAAAVHADVVGAAGDRNLWIVGGGDRARQFADAGPLLPRRLELRLEETARNGDFVTARFSVVR